ncbi:metabolite traffic protein EboE [Spirillospora sp. CA-294931]|uniref:metabolite traffic protein EboE n=1 Tax=Spirillospora sp. CA-294931 TaxID=3240042 RepID=UPI003D8FF05B
MRFRHPDGTRVHLAYCTNVHPAEQLDGVMAQLSRFTAPIRRRLGADRLGVGLWLARGVQRELLAAPRAVHRLRGELDRLGLEVVTLNAFPYSGFQAATVKKSVYRPDWTEPERLDYTLGCARVLSELLPDDVARGSVSTLPIAWRAPWTAKRAALASRNLDSLAAGLAALEAETGRTVRVGLEPEPGCVLERVAQAPALLAGLDTERIGVCVDACHLAVGFEDPVAACARLAKAGLPVVKAQASCAVRADLPADPEQRAALTRLAEPRFLHQTREAPVPPAVVPTGADDLPEALGGGLPGAGPWRVHYHVPLHSGLPAPLRATVPELLGTLATLVGGPSARTDHIEVETYTWPVLRGSPTDADLIEGIAAELAWTRATLISAGLKEEIR